MKEELHNLEKARTWDFVDLPTGKIVVGCKWVYKIKTCADVQWSDIKLDLWQKVLPKSMVLTIRKILLRWLV